jgi:hypothetical protein
MKSPTIRKVAGETHLQDGGDLEVQPLLVARPLLLAPRLIRIEVAQALLQPLLRRQAEVGLDRHAAGRGKVGQLRLAQHQ